MIKRYGYYIPKQDLLSGDQELALESKAIYDGLGFTKACDHERCGQGELCPKRYYKYVGHYDGMSIFHRDGEVIKRVVLTDFFSTKFRHIVRDYPFT